MICSCNQEQSVNCAQIQSCPLGYAVLVPCLTTSKHLSSDTTEVYCPAGCMSKNLSVWGTDIYTENTPVCLAAIHSGIISNGGGYITVQKMPGQEAYTGSILNGIFSLSSGISTTSFTFPSSSTQIVTQSTTLSTNAASSSTSLASNTPSTTNFTSTFPTTTAPAKVTSVFTTTTSTIPIATTIVTKIGLIGCSTYLDLLQGDPLLIECPANCNILYVAWGTDIYTSDSDLCPTAIHAGVITAAGGYVTVKREPLQDIYVGSYRNGIATLSTTSLFNKESYRFL
ncbi:cysteine-rich secretory protein LCCL domain-containing 2-like isoform X2 [Phyllobates terribilis]|uniref:cysteine-rich secretory protein LCCL domain-containing 2-like isoform X2 n=1 Tax=Phyllobates terribilis TaxID=111132 RepID=UPI003CCB01E9